MEGKPRAQTDAVKNSDHSTSKGGVSRGWPRLQGAKPPDPQWSRQLRGRHWASSCPVTSAISLIRKAILGDPDGRAKLCLVIWAEQPLQIGLKVLPGNERLGPGGDLSSQHTLASLFPFTPSQTPRMPPFIARKWVIGCRTGSKEMLK